MHGMRGKRGKHGMRHHRHHHLHGMHGGGPGAGPMHVPVAMAMAPDGFLPRHHAPPHLAPPGHFRHHHPYHHADVLNEGPPLGPGLHGHRRGRHGLAGLYDLHGPDFDGEARARPRHPSPPHCMSPANALEEEELELKVAILDSKIRLLQHNLCVLRDPARAKRRAAGKQKKKPASPKRAAKQDQIARIEARILRFHRRRGILMRKLHQRGQGMRGPRKQKMMECLHHLRHGKGKGKRAALQGLPFSKDLPSDLTAVLLDGRMLLRPGHGHGHGPKPRAHGRHGKGGGPRGPHGPRGLRELSLDQVLSASAAMVGGNDLSAAKLYASPRVVERFATGKPSDAAADKSATKQRQVVQCPPRGLARALLADAKQLADQEERVLVVSRGPDVLNAACKLPGCQIMRPRRFMMLLRRAGLTGKQVDAAACGATEPALAPLNDAAEDTAEHPDQRREAEDSEDDSESESEIDVGDDDADSDDDDDADMDEDDDLDFALALALSLEDASGADTDDDDKWELA